MDRDDLFGNPADPDAEWLPAQLTARSGNLDRLVTALPTAKGARLLSPSLAALLKGGHTGRMRTQVTEFDKPPNQKTSLCHLRHGSYDHYPCSLYCDLKRSGSGKCTDGVCKCSL